MTETEVRDLAARINAAHASADPVTAHEQGFEPGSEPVVYVHVGDRLLLTLRRDDFLDALYVGATDSGPAFGDAA